jgi:hypothetical protein
MDCPPAGDGTLLLPFIQPPIVLLQAEAEALICGMAMHLGGCEMAMNHSRCGNA